MRYIKKIYFRMILKKFNMERAKPSATLISTMLKLDADPNGKKIITYEWSLGEMTNNRAEAYIILLSTRLLNKNAIKDPIIIGDSAIIIAALDAKRDFKSIAFNKIYQRIKKSFETLGKITIKHVLRNQNKDVDIHANKAIDRPIGIIKENNEVYEESIP